jgi:arylsulfatase A-like enzyme
MYTPALILALVVARVTVLWGRSIDVSAESLAAYFAQDAIVAFGFLLGEVVLHRWRTGRRMVALTFWGVVLYVAFNVAVARVLPTPLTWPMLRAAGAPIADSIRLYATAAALGSVVAVIAVAGVGAWMRRPLAAAAMRALCVGLLVVGAGGWMAGRRAETWGLHRNAVVTLITSALPTAGARESAEQAAGEWRSPPFESGAPRDLSSLSGIAAGRHVVVIALESVGAQYLQLYGAGKDVMPRLEALAAQAVVFDSAHAVSPDSIRSLMSVLCSRYPAFDTPVEAYATGTCGSLSGALRSRGYRTALFHSGRFGYLGMAGVIHDRGFETLEDAGHIGGNHESSFGVDEQSTVQRMLSWIDVRDPSERFALTYMPVAGHHPYVFPGRGAFGASTDLDRYRSALHDGDVAIGVLIDGLEARGLLEQTMFVVYGDHGQAFGQHPGNVGHTFYLYEENVRVPFFVAVPGAISSGIRSDMTTSLVDVTPTAFDLLGLSVDSDHQGQSALAGPPRMALMFTDYGSSLVGLRDGRWKFIHDLGTGRSRLFDIERDPAESRDLSAAEPARVRAYVDALRRWASAQRARWGRGR